MCLYICVCVCQGCKCVCVGGGGGGGGGGRGEGYNFVESARPFNLSFFILLILLIFKCKMILCPAMLYPPKF